MTTTATKLWMPCVILGVCSMGTVSVAAQSQVERVDVANMARPIAALDSVWIEELTMLEVRDAIREGKTTALILTRGIEENGIHEVLEGLHDDYYISSIMMNADPTSVRMEQRIEAGKFAINGVSLSPAEETIANGKKIIGFRTEATVAAIRRAMASGSR